MLADLVLPPGYSIQITYDPDAGPMDATIAVLRGEAWLGEVTVPAARLDRPDDIQAIVDGMTRRGVREVKRPIQKS